MNIGDLVARSGKRVWIVVFTVVLAGAAAFVLSFGQPRQFVATASVTVVQPAGTAPTSQVVSQSVENLRSAVDSRGLANVVSAETGSSIGDVQDALSSQRLRSGNVVEIVAESERPAVAVAIAESAALTAIRLQVQSEVAVVEQTVALARARYEEADSNLSVFAIEAGLGDPEAELEALSTTLRDARLAAPAVAGSDETTARLIQAVADAELAVQAVLPSVLRYRGLALEKDAAFDRWSDSLSRQLEAQATASVASTLLVVPPEQATAVSRRQEIAQSVIAASVLGLVLGVAILAVIEVFPSRTRRRSVLSQDPPTR